MKSSSKVLINKFIVSSIASISKVFFLFFPIFTPIMNAQNLVQEISLST